MAWHIPREKMANNPLSEDVVRKRFEDKGYEIIKYCYKTKYTKMPCYDKNRYIVMVSYDSLSKDTIQYERFSLDLNGEYIYYNFNRYAELHPNIDFPKIIDMKYIYVGKTQKKQMRLLCVCPECGAEFGVNVAKWKNANKHRCNKCSKVISGLEYKVKLYLEKNDVNFVQQYKFIDCKDKRCLPFDFYLPEQNICIEVDGQQHYGLGRLVERHIISQEEFDNIVKHDKIKTEYCKKNDIILLRLSYMDMRSDKYEQKIKEYISNK